MRDISSLPKTRKDAKEQDIKYYFTGVPCKSGHVCERMTKWKTCVECNRSRATVHYRQLPKEVRQKRRRETHEKYRDENIERMKQYAKRNPDRVAALKQKWHDNNPDKVIALGAAYYARNKEAIGARCKTYREENRSRYSVLAAKRRSKKANATPEWLTDAHHLEIAAIYEEARRLTEETGVAHHVDHIVPLQGKAVCGLHVPWNLQILTASENCSKSNKLLT